MNTEVIIGGILLLAIIAFVYLRLRALHLTTVQAVKADLAKHYDSVVSTVQQQLSDTKASLTAHVAAVVSNVEKSNVLASLNASLNGSGSNGATPTTVDEHAKAAAQAADAAVRAAATAQAASVAENLKTAAAAVNAAPDGSVVEVKQN